ncbi:MAG: DUF350 domain-containing protein [Spirochaetota bacterium]|nr:DUF350 domain-containing protein [Spirochaetota bacterium]
MDNLKALPTVTAYVALGIIFLLIGKWVYDLLTKYKLDDELTKSDNPAVGTALFGYFVALIIIIAGVLPTDRNVKLLDSEGLLNVAIYSFIGIILLNISRVITDKLILYKFKINKELIDDRNVGTGFVLMGSYIASGLVIVGALSGDIHILKDIGGTAQANKILPFGDLFSSLGGYSSNLISGVLLSLIFFILGQITFIIYSFIYGWVLPFNSQEEIEKDNVAAGISFGGGLVALGLILFKGIHGRFEGWESSLVYYGWLVIYAIIVFPLVRIFVDKIMLSNSTLSKEIVEDKNINAALLEIICILMVSAVVIFAY